MNSICSRLCNPRLKIIKRGFLKRIKVAKILRIQLDIISKPAILLNIEGFKRMIRK